MPQTFTRRVLSDGPVGTIWSMNYPVEQHPLKVKSTSFKSEGDTWEGELVGIKGQYLITTAGVFNVRSHEGYIVNLELF